MAKASKCVKVELHTGQVLFQAHQNGKEGVGSVSLRVLVKCLFVELAVHLISWASLISSLPVLGETFRYCCYWGGVCLTDRAYP
jgi:hypothetical protein